MAITIDPAARRIILDGDYHTAGEIWSRWYDWFVQGENSKYPVAFRQVGGDALGGGLFIPVYFFLLNGWRVRPREADHTLVIDGNLFVDGGGTPVVRTLGNYNVAVQYTVPVVAQAVSTSGSALTAEQIASAVVAALNATRIPVDASRINGAVVVGTGQDGDPWRGVGVPAT